MKHCIFFFAFTLLFSSFLSAQVDSDNPGTTEQFIEENLYVAGSLGIGDNMYNGYSFGYNTQVFLENNLRILFDDNSNTSSFPSRSWQIEINSAADGGEDYFRINDIDEGTSPFSIMGEAPSHSLYIKGSSGNVGMGTNNPLTKLHLTKDDTPAIRLEQTTTSGFSAQSWDVAGNEASFFIRDVTNGSRLPFRILPGTPSNTLTMNSNGFVGIGTVAPQHTLEVVGDAQINDYLYFGDESSEGTWRVSVISGKLTFEKRENGVWITKMEME